MEHTNAAPKLRTRSVPQPVKQPSFSRTWSRSQSAAASTHEYPRLPEDATITNHRTVEDLRARQWDFNEQKMTSAFFLVWAVGVVLLGGWHVANQLSACMVQVAVAALAATSAPVAYLRHRRLNRSAPEGAPCFMG
jgi:hypothetical protein